MNHIKLIVAGILALLVLIIILQNLEESETHILMMTITMPRAVLIFITLVMGFLAGFLTSSWFWRRREKDS